LSPTFPPLPLPFSALVEGRSGSHAIRDLVFKPELPDKTRKETSLTPIVPLLDTSLTTPATSPAFLHGQSDPSPVGHPQDRYPPRFSYVV